MLDTPWGNILMQCSPTNTAVIPQIKGITLINIIDYFSIALFSSHEQTHCSSYVSSACWVIWMFPLSTKLWRGLQDLQHADVLFPHVYTCREPQFRVSSKGLFAKFKWKTCPVSMSVRRYSASSGALTDLEANSQKGQGWADCLGCTGLSAERVKIMIIMGT